MRSSATILFAVFALASAAPVIAMADAPAAGTTTAPAAAPAVKAKPALDPNQVICKRVADTGSRIGGDETCLTRAQWDDIAETARKRFDEARQRAQPGPPRNAAP